MLKNISMYSLIGILNTSVHWVVFYVLYLRWGEQSYSNLIAFLCAATLSFIMNSKFNFKTKISINKYFLFLGGMGIISFIIGLFSDEFSLSPIVTLVVFSTASLMLGYVYSKFLVFR